MRTLASLMIVVVAGCGVATTPRDSYNVSEVVATWRDHVGDVVDVRGPVAHVASDGYAATIEHGGASLVVLVNASSPPLPTSVRAGRVVTVRGVLRDADGEPSLSDARIVSP